jgi:REP element-mobilizing transposase RayT
MGSDQGKSLIATVSWHKKHRLSA